MSLIIVWTLALSAHPRFGTSPVSGQGALRKAAHVQFARRTEKAVRRVAVDERANEGTLAQEQ
jgi:hypothetical protein